MKMDMLSYNRIIKDILILVMCSVLLTSCSNTQAESSVLNSNEQLETSILNSDITASTQIALNENSQLYSYYETIDLINGFMGEYIALNSEGEYIVCYQEQILDFSEEGGELTSFYNNQDLLRCRLIIYGTTGRVEQNYYVGDKFCYYTILNSMYEAYPLTKSKGEVLYYAFDEYCIYEDKVYRIDRINELLIPCEQNPVSSIILENIQSE